MINNLGKALMGIVPAYSPLIAKLCQRYLDRYNGDNNSNPELNGEHHLLREFGPSLRGGVVFDVGANIGEWAKVVLSAQPDVALHCFEPVRETYAKLAAEHWPSNVHTNNFALGEAESELEMNIVGSTSGLNSLYVRRGVDAVRGESKEVIHVTTMDAYCEENAIESIDYVKIDVEGHELAVLKGMFRMLGERRIGMIQFEYGGCNLDSRVYLLDIWDYLAPFEFDIYKIYPDGPKLVPQYHRGLETFKYSNWLAQRR